MPEKKVLRFEFRETDLGVIFRVAEQSHRGKEFGEDGCSFLAKDGLDLESAICPISVEEYGRVNVRGINKSEDDRLCVCTHAFAERIKQAEREYCEYFCGEEEEMPEPVPNADEQLDLLGDIRNVLATCVRVPVEDSLARPAIEAACRQMPESFGALMAQTSRMWREALAEKDFPVGGEFTVGPCRKTVETLIENIDAVLER